MKLGDLIINLPSGNFDNSCMSYIDKGGIHVLSPAAKDANIRNKQPAKKVIPILDIAFLANNRSAIKYTDWIKSIVRDELGYSNRDTLSHNSYDYPSYKECKLALKGIR